MNASRFLLPLLLLPGFAGCSGNKESYPPKNITALYEDIAQYASLDSAGRACMLSDDSQLLHDYMAVLDCPLVTDSVMLMVSRSKPIEVFTPDVQRVYPSLDSLEMHLGYICGAAATRGLNLNIDRYAAVVWGRPQSVVFVDSTMLIALNHYLGADYEGYAGMPAFRVGCKTPHNLPYDMAESLVANAYPFEGGQSPTLLSHMLYDGAVIAAKLELVDGATAGGTMGLTPEQLKWFDDNEANMWRALAAGRLLYETSGFKIDRIMLPAPSTDLVNPNAPGRAGRYVGYRIVQAYRKRHPEATLAQLLSPSFYNGENTLSEAGYNPR